MTGLESRRGSIGLVHDGLLVNVEDHHYGGFVIRALFLYKYLRL